MFLLGLGLALPLFGTLDAANAERRKPLRQTQAAQPLKNCHRYNSWYGFYGNIWCTPAEQQRWDRWDAARFGR